MWYIYIYISVVVVLVVVTEVEVVVGAVDSTVETQVIQQLKVALITRYSRTYIPLIQIQMLNLSSRSSAKL